MSQDEATTDIVTTQAADLVSTILSVPLIWPKSTVAASLAAIAVFVGITIVQITKPAILPVLPLDRARIAEIEQQIQQADMAARGQMNSAVGQPAGEYLGYMHAVSDPDHVEGRHGSPSVHDH